MNQTSLPGPGSTTPDPARRRRTRDRSGSERDLLAAAMRLLERDGILAGLNLREVADEAGVNRGLIYQYFGSRRELLRAAITEFGWADAEVFDTGRALPFTERRHRVFAEAIRSRETIRLAALLALDGDEGATMFPMLDNSRADLARDQREGTLDADVDAIAAHVVTAATYLGYAVAREVFAREVDVAPDDLDRRILQVFARMLRALTPGSDQS